MYAGHPQWEHAVMSSDTFTYPLLAALGAARDYPAGRPAVEGPEEAAPAGRRPSAQRLGGPSDDPLALLGDGPDRLGTILAGISSKSRNRTQSPRDHVRRIPPLLPARRGAAGLSARLGPREARLTDVRHGFQTSGGPRPPFVFGRPIPPYGDDRPDTRRRASNLRSAPSRTVPGTCSIE